MGQRVLDGWGLGAEFAPLAHALASRGFCVRPVSRGRDRESALFLDGLHILWHPHDDPALRAAAFDNGVDEVVGPWMDVAEAAARIGRLIERNRTGNRASGDAHIQCGDLTIGLIDRAVARAGRPIDLLAREYALLLCLARRRDRAVSRMELLRDVWRLDFDPGTNRVEVHMSRLRAKVDRGFRRPLLHTVKGRGYALCVSADGILSA